MAEICSNELWMKLKGMYLFKSVANRFRMEEDMDLRVHLGAFNTLV
jgi:hypothetical protein